MKKLVLSFLIACGLSLSATALIQTRAVLPNNQKEVVQQNDRVKIKAERLPDAVKDAFEESDYGSLKVESIFEVTGKEGKSYEYVLLNGADKWAVRYSEEGKFLDEKKVNLGK